MIGTIKNSRISINRNIVECKAKRGQNMSLIGSRINRNIVECKDSIARDYKEIEIGRAHV